VRFVFHCFTGFWIVYAGLSLYPFVLEAGHTMQGKVFSWFARRESSKDYDGMLSGKDDEVMS